MDARVELGHDNLGWGGADKDRHCEERGTRDEAIHWAFPLALTFPWIATPRIREARNDEVARERLPLPPT